MTDRKNHHLYRHHLHTSHPW